MLVADRLAVDSHALIQSNQVRAGEPPGAKPKLTQNALNNSGGRCLAVCAGDVNNAIRLLRVTQQLDSATGWLESRAQFVLGNTREQRIHDFISFSCPVALGRQSCSLNLRHRDLNLLPLAYLDWVLRIANDCFEFERKRFTLDELNVISHSGNNF